MKKEENEKAVREFLANSAYDRKAIAMMELQETRDKLDKEAAYTYDTYAKIKIIRTKDGEEVEQEIYKKLSKYNYLF